jgi:hypothetical protein
MLKFLAFGTISIIIIVAMGGCALTPFSPLETQTPAIIFNPAAATPSNSIISGTVQEIETDELFILSPENEKIRLLAPDQSRIWDGTGWVGEIPIEIGDDVIATGVWAENKSVFIVQNLYINIVHLRGIVGEMDKENLQFVLNDPRQGANTVIVNALTEVYLTNENRQDAFQDLQILPDMGEYVEVIGRKLKDGKILAVNMTIP